MLSLIIPDINHLDPCVQSIVILTNNDVTFSFCIIIELQNKNVVFETYNEDIKTTNCKKNIYIVSKNIAKSIWHLLQYYGKITKLCDKLDRDVRFQSRWLRYVAFPHLKLLPAASAIFYLSVYHHLWILK